MYCFEMFKVINMTKLNYYQGKGKMLEHSRGHLQSSIDLGREKYMEIKQKCFILTANYIFFNTILYLYETSNKRNVHINFKITLDLTLSST